MKRAADLLKLQIPAVLARLQRGADRLAPAQVDDVAERLGALLTLAEGYDREREALAADADLSPQGKEKALVKLAQRVLQSLAKFESETVGAARARSASLAADVAKRAAPSRPTDPAERLAYELRLGEIRQDLRRADPVERWLLYASATDPLVIDAIETAPPMLVRAEGRTATLEPFVDPERVAFSRLERVRARDPETAATVELLERLAEVYAMSVANVRVVVVEDAPALRDDPIAAAALGESASSAGARRQA